MEDKEGFTTFQSPLVRSPVVSPSNNRNNNDSGQPGSRMSMKRTSRMSDVREGALAEQGALSIKPISPAEASEARRSVNLSRSPVSSSGLCSVFEPNVFLPDLCAKCSRKRASHGPPPSEEKAGVEDAPNVSVKANNSSSPTAAAIKSPKGKSPRGGLSAKSPPPAKHGYNDDDLFSSSDDDEDGDANNNRAAWAKGVDGGDSGGEGTTPISRMMARFGSPQLKVDTAEGQQHKKSADRAKSPSLKLAEVTPSKITPELKQELCDIILGRRRRLYNITDDKVPVGGQAPTAPLLPDLPPDAEPIRERMRITTTTESAGGSGGAVRRSVDRRKFQTLPARGPEGTKAVDLAALSEEKGRPGRRSSRSPCPEEEGGGEKKAGGREQQAATAATTSKPEGKGGEAGDDDDVAVPKARTAAKAAAADGGDDEVASAKGAGEPGGEEASSRRISKPRTPQALPISLRGPSSSDNATTSLSTEGGNSEGARQPHHHQRSTSSARPPTSSPLGSPLASTTTAPSVENPIFRSSFSAGSGGGRGPLNSQASDASSHGGMMSAPINVSSRPSSPSLVLAMEPSALTTAARSSANSPLANSAIPPPKQQLAASSSSNSISDDKAAAGGAPLRRGHRPSQVSREFKHEVIEYLDRVQSADLDLRPYNSATSSPANKHHHEEGKGDAAGDDDDGGGSDDAVATDENMDAEDGALIMPVPVVKVGKSKSPVSTDSAGAAGPHSRHTSLDHHHHHHHHHHHRGSSSGGVAEEEPPPTKAKLTQWLRRPLVAHAQSIKTLCRRIRPSPGQVLMPSRFIMHLPDFENKAVLLAEGQSALDPRTSTTYQIYVGPGPKGESVAALKKLPRDGNDETIYQLLYCDDKKGTWGETAIFRFTPGSTDRHTVRQVEVWLTKGAEAWAGGSTDSKDTLAATVTGSGSTGAAAAPCPHGVTRLHQRDPMWNRHAKRLEMPVVFGHMATKASKGEASIKTVQLVEQEQQALSSNHGMVVLQFFRASQKQQGGDGGGGGDEGGDGAGTGGGRDVFAVDAGAPFSLIQAFAFAIANMECEAKGAKVCVANSGDVGKHMSSPQNECVGDDGPPEVMLEDAPPSKDLYSSFIRHVAAPIQHAWSQRAPPPSNEGGGSSRYQQQSSSSSSRGGGGGGKDGVATPRPASPVRGGGRAYHGGGDGSSGSSRRDVTRQEEVEEAASLGETFGETDGQQQYQRGARGEAYDSNTTSLAQLRAAWDDGVLRLSLDEYRPSELRKLLEVPPLTVVDFFLLSKALFYRTPTHARLCLTYLLLSMVAELYPLSPTYNTTLAMASLYITNHIQDFKESFLLAYFMLHVASLLFDLSWIMQTYSGIFMSQLKYLCVAMVAVNMGLKLCIIVGTLRTTIPGVSVLQFVGSYLKLLLPPAMGATRKGLLVEVYGRLILLTWMHFLGGLAFLVMFITITIRFPFEADFQTDMFQIPLSVVLLFKGITSLIVSGAMFRNMQLTPCLGMFGCLSCCYEWAMVKEAKHARKYGVDSPPVLINGEWAKLVMLIKSCDVLVAVFLWAILLNNYDQLLVLSQYSVQQMCATIFALSILLDVWGFVLGGAVAWLYSVHKYRKSLNGGGGDHEAGGGGRKKELSVGPGYMNARSWAMPDSDDDDDFDGGDARPVNMDDIENNATVFQPNATYSSPRRPVRSSNNNEDDDQGRGGGGWEAAPYSQQQQQQQDGAYSYSNYDDPQQGSSSSSFSLPPLTFLDAFTFSPQDFEYLWHTLPPLVGFDCAISYVPTVAEVTWHLQSTCFFVIASGSQGPISRVYACARGRDEKGGNSDVSFLAEIILDSQQYTMGTTFKCDDVDRIGEFMAMLSLRDIVGDYTAIPDGPHTINAY